MLVWGTANPEGLGDSYNGLFFRAADIQQSVDEIVGKPVKIEHKGADVGRVVSAWTDRAGKLDLLLEINTRDVEVTPFVRLLFYVLADTRGRARSSRASSATGSAATSRSGTRSR